MFVYFICPEGLSENFVPGTFPEDAGLSLYIQTEGGVASGGLLAIGYVLIADGIPVAKMAPGFLGRLRSSRRVFWF